MGHFYETFREFLYFLKFDSPIHYMEKSSINILRSTFFCFQRRKKDIHVWTNIRTEKLVNYSCLRHVIGKTCLQQGPILSVLESDRIITQRNPRGTRQQIQSSDSSILLRASKNMTSCWERELIFLFVIFS